MNVPLSLRTRFDRFIEATLDACPECGGALHEHEEVVTKQQIEIVKKPYIVKEYHVHSYTCPVCETTHRAVEPEESRSGLFSAGLIALAAYLKGRCHVSFRALQAFFQDVFGKYIPAFEYELVELNKYRREDLIEFCDALSFIMIIDKLGTKEGLQALKKLPQNYLEQLRLKVPENLSRLMTDVITALLDRLEAPGEEIAAVTDLIERKEYRTMFDALVESVLADKRQAVQQAKEEARQEWERALWERERAIRQEKQEGARRLKQMGVSPGIIAAGFGLSLGEIERL
jgi:transcription initiation factor IIE alpha subunit